MGGTWGGLQWARGLSLLRPMSMRMPDKMAGGSACCLSVPSHGPNCRSLWSLKYVTWQAAPGTRRERGEGASFCQGACSWALLKTHMKGLGPFVVSSACGYDWTIFILSRFGDWPRPARLMQGSL